jgi:RNA polymerase sigma factor (sigma-70 family)
MTETQSPDIALFWSESLAEELLGFLTARLKCPEAAADLTHETFLRFHQYVKENPPDNARALAYRIAVNLATDYQRKNKIRNSLTVEATGLADFYPSTAPGPEQIVMANQRLQQLHAALAELPADCRTAFLLHGFDGLTYAQIADHLGISVSMVYKHLARAMDYCTERLTDTE